MGMLLLEEKNKIWLYLEDLQSYHSQ